MGWEYTMVTDSDDRHFMLQLNLHGTLGWEAIDVGLDRGLVVRYQAVLKRPLRSFPPPTSSEAAWQPDPSGRHEQRYWDGLRWTEHVTTNGGTDIDYPYVR